MPLFRFITKLFRWKSPVTCRFTTFVVHPEKLREFLLSHPGARFAVDFVELLNRGKEPFPTAADTLAKQLVALEQLHFGCMLLVADFRPG